MIRCCKLIVTILSIVLISIAGELSLTMGQNGYEGTSSTSTPCELNIAYLEAASAKVDAGEFLILVARLGKNETDDNIALLRLHNAAAYLSGYLGIRAASTIVRAHDLRNTDGREGTVDIYVKGKLFATLVIRENSYLNVGSCEPADEETQEQKERKQRYLYPHLSADKILVNR